MRIFFSFLVLLVFAISSLAQNLPLTDLLVKGLDRGYPGIAMMIQRADGSVESAAAGYSDLEHLTAMRPGDAFHIASITKTITAVATLLLVDSRKLRMDTTLASLLRDRVSAIPNAEKITVAQLLDHSSGIYATNNDMDYLRTVIGPEADPHRVWKPDELVALANGDRQKPGGDPGTGHFYSDTNYVLLGMIVEKISGTPFKQYVTQTVLQPLEMKSTYFYSDYLDSRSTPPVKTVQGYVLATPELLSIIAVSPMFKKARATENGNLMNTTLAAERIDAAAGIVSTLPNLLKFASALFHGKLLTPSSQEFLFAAARDMDKEPVGTSRIRTLQSICKEYGVLLYKEGDGPGGVNTLMAFDPVKDQTYVGFTNTFGHFNEIEFFMDDVIASLQ